MFVFFFLDQLCKNKLKLLSKWLTPQQLKHCSNFYFPEYSFWNKRMLHHRQFTHLGDKVYRNFLLDQKKYQPCSLLDRHAGWRTVSLQGKEDKWTIQLGCTALNYRLCSLLVHICWSNQQDMALIYRHLDTHDQLRMCCSLSAWSGLCTDPQGSSLGKTFPRVDTDDPQNIPNKVMRTHYFQVIVSLDTIHYSASLCTYLKLVRGIAWHYGYYWVFFFFFPVVFKIDQKIIPFSPSPSPC